MQILFTQKNIALNYLQLLASDKEPCPHKLPTDGQGHLYEQKVH